MLIQEKQEYERKRKALQYDKQKSKIVTGDQQSANESTSASAIVYEKDETDFTINGIVNCESENEAETIINII